MGATAAKAKTGKMRKTAELGADFWNDSCALNELSEAVALGAVGATSNPVIVLNAVSGDKATWLPVIDGLVAQHPEATEDAIAWRLVETIGRKAAKLLEPVYRESKGRKGFLSIQVDPRLYRHAREMAAHGRALAQVAPNVAIKLPATPAGIAAMEELVASGVNINATVSFSVAQAVAVAEAMERALDAARSRGRDMEKLHPYVTIMVGRVDDHVKRSIERDAVAIDPGAANWAGIAVFKRAHGIFLERGYRSTLLSAAYRHVLHWSELIGERAILSIPYAWWKQFEASDVKPRASLREPVDGLILRELSGKVPEFRKAYEPDGLTPEGFARYGATVHTLHQFLDGYAKLAAVVRERMLA